MFFVGTNHLFPAPEHFDDMVLRFAENNDERPITERWGALLFEIARPAEGNIFHSTSHWPSKAAFDAWRASEDFERSHLTAREDNRRGDFFTQHPIFVASELVLNAEPGRAPIIGDPQPRRELGAGRGYVFQRWWPKPEYVDQVIALAAARPLPPGAIWWDLRRVVGSNELVSVTYYPDLESARRAAPSLQPPGDPSWYAAPPETSLYLTEVERVPGMARNNRRTPAAAR
ncbi:MAG: antibiotic biosynthesis monooxygenase [Chloroflexi bacterium]|jgi:heme-degrading monooxygenase HmoA|nr:antibiotic biosynthesis monooxygenase [Chloroflexota bacterium]